MSRIPSTGPRQATGSRTLRVLVVDDDRMQLRAIERVLRDQHEVDLTVADNAIDAMIAVGVVKPDLVIMDILMPGLDGIEACRRIKGNSATSDIQIVLASAMMTPELERAARQAGARRAVSKPVDLVELLGSAIVAPAAGEIPEPSPSPTIRGADLVVEMLTEAGIEVVFGLPGGAIAPVQDALLDSRLRVVTTRHESGAMFAAAGYARATGRPAVVTVTSGPGALNALTGLGSAWCDGLPVLLLVGEVPRPMQGKGVLQDSSSQGLQIVEMARYVSKFAAEVPRASNLPHLLRRALDTMCAGRPGPAMLTLPLDVMLTQVHRIRAAGTPITTHAIAGEQLDEIAGLLCNAQRPLLLAGSGVRGGDAPVQLRTVAERLACPVATTPKGKGTFPEAHPLALGVLGVGGHRSAQRYLETGVDVVVALGTSLGDLSSNGFSPHLQVARAMVQVDIDPRQIGKSYEPSHAVVATASEFLRGIADRCVESMDRQITLRSLPGPVERHVLPSSRHADRIAPQDALVEIQEILPADTIYTIDSGEHFWFATHYLETQLPEAFVAMSGLGSMGPSVGAAIGTQLAFPSRTVAAICGDGCFAMNAFEVATAAHERLPIRVFVFNDRRFGMVERGHRTLYGRTPEWPTTPLDVCTVGRGLGATVLCVKHPGQLRAAREMLRSAPGPVVVDVCIDAEILLPRIERVALMSAGDGAKPRK